MSPFKSKKSESVDLQYDASLVFKVLTDFDNYYEWIPFVTGSRLLAQEGDLAIAELVIRKPYSKLALESIHSKDELVLLRQISGDCPLQELVWRISTPGDGQCKVSLELKLERSIKSLLGSQPNYWQHKDLFKALESRVAFLSGVPGAQLPIQKLVEVIETDKGLVLWLLGKKYLLQALPEEEND